MHRYRSTTDGARVSPEGCEKSKTSPDGNSPPIITAKAHQHKPRIHPCPELLDLKTNCKESKLQARTDARQNSQPPARAFTEPSQQASKPVNSPEPASKPINSQARPASKHASQHPTPLSPPHPHEKKSTPIGRQHVQKHDTGAPSYQTPTHTARKSPWKCIAATAETKNTRFRAPHANSPALMALPYALLTAEDTMLTTLFVFLASDFTALVPPAALPFLSADLRPPAPPPDFLRLLVPPATAGEG